MKIQVIHGNDEAIEGFTVIDIQRGIFQLSEIINNSCTEIMLINCLDLVDGETASNILYTACQKIRLGGKITITGIDIKVICRNVLNNQINNDVLNNTLANIKSFRSVADIESVLKNYNLTIDTIALKGHIYEIKASRPNN